APRDRVEAHGISAELAASLGNVERDRERCAPQLVAEVGVSPRDLCNQLGGDSQKSGGGLVSVEALEAKHAPFSAAEALRVRLWTRQRLRQRLRLRPGPGPGPGPRPRPRIYCGFCGDSSGVGVRAILRKETCARELSQ